MRCHAVLLSAAVTLALAAGVDARGQTFDGPHARPLDQASAALLANAQQQSATVRDLLGTLEASNVVAYVHVAPLAKGEPESGLSFVGTSKMARFVLISISGHAAGDRQMELLGRELQHAVEIAAMPWVTDAARFQYLMSVVGWPDANGAQRGYQTAAANRTARQVRREIHGIRDSQR